MTTIEGHEAREELRKRCAALEAQIQRYELALREAEAILGGEYADRYMPLFELICAARKS